MRERARDALIRWYGLVKDRMQQQLQCVIDDEGKRKAHLQLASWINEHNFVCIGISFFFCAADCLAGWLVGYFAASSLHILLMLWARYNFISLFFSFFLSFFFFVFNLFFTPFCVRCALMLDRAAVFFLAETKKPKYFVVNCTNPFVPTIIEIEIKTAAAATAAAVAVAIWTAKRAIENVYQNPTRIHLALIYIGTRACGLQISVQDHCGALLLKFDTAYAAFECLFFLSLASHSLRTRTHTKDANCCSLKSKYRIAWMYGCVCANALYTTQQVSFSIVVAITKPTSPGSHELVNNQRF